MQPCGGIRPSPNVPLRQISTSARAGLARRLGVAVADVHCEYVQNATFTNRSCGWNEADVAPSGTPIRGFFVKMSHDGIAYEARGTYANLDAVRFAQVGDGDHDGTWRRDSRGILIPG